MLFLAITLPWVIVAFGIWFGYMLLRQNGRILMQLEAIAQQLGQTTEQDNAQVSPGELAPEFELTDLDGKRTTLSEFRGSRILLIFFDPQCRFCKAMAPSIADLSSNGSYGRLIPVVVTMGDEKEISKLVHKYGIRCRVLLQRKNEVGLRYGAQATPSGCLIDEQGRIASSLALGAKALLKLAAGLPGTEANHPGNEENKTRREKVKLPLSFSRIQRAGLAKGTQAPNFRLEKLGGGVLSLEDYRGRKVVVVFSDPDCGPCDRLAPQLEQLHQQISTIEILMVSRRDPEANRRKVEEFSLTFPVVLQRRWEISRLYGIFSTPVAFSINEEGIIDCDVAIGGQQILDVMRGRAQEWTPITKSMASY